MSITLKPGSSVVTNDGRVLGTTKEPVIITFSPEHSRFVSTAHEDRATQLNRLTVKHYRLSLMMGDEYAEQMIIALHTLATKGRESYEELLDEALFASFHAASGGSFRSLGLSRKR